MKRILFAALAAFITSSALAASASVTLSFTRPTAFSDGSTLPAASITGYAVGCEFTPTGGAVGPCSFTPASIPGGTATSGAITLTYPASGGVACFTLRTQVGTNESAASSPPACKTLAPIAPNPPSNVTVTVTIALQLSSASPITVALLDTKVEKN